MPSVNYCDGLDRCFRFVCIYAYGAAFLCATGFSVNKDLYRKYRLYRDSGVRGVAKRPVTALSNRLEIPGLGDFTEEPYQRHLSATANTARDTKCPILFASSLISRRRSKTRDRNATDLARIIILYLLFANKVA